MIRLLTTGVLFISYCTISLAQVQPTSLPLELVEELMFFEASFNEHQEPLHVFFDTRSVDIHNSYTFSLPL